MSASVPSFSPSETPTHARPSARAVIGGTILGLIGAILLVVTLAVVTAWVMDVRGFVTRPADQAVIARLVPTVPLIIAVAAIHLVAAGGLVLAQRWAGSLGFFVALAGVAAAVLGLIAVGSGHDPFAGMSTVSASVARSDGLGTLGVVLGLYAVAAVLLSRPGREV